MKPVLLILLLTLLSGLTESSRMDIQEKMEPFDEALIPLWMYLKNNDMYMAKRAVFSTHFQWQQMKQKCVMAYPKREDWAATFDRSEEWLQDAIYAVDANCGDVAQNQLRHLRYELANLRERYDIDYLFDDLYAFEDQAAVVVTIADDAMLCLLDWNEFEVENQLLNQLWTNVKVAMHKRTEKKAGKQAQLRFWKDKVEERLLFLNQELDCANREEVALAAERVVEAFDQCLRAYGNFEANRTYFAEF
ncbi:MAG: hypothetical protein MRY78_05255 [Saprospiraceae bacterium]|nr:hypothetical protein [Saprospiraceae bacterium]